MRRSHLILGIGGVASVLCVAGLVAAQDTSKPPPPPAAAVPAPPPTLPVAASAPPVVKALANAVSPEEGPPPPKADIAANATTKADDAPPPAEEPSAEPLKRPRYAAAVMQAVDKLTAETLRFETKIGEPVRFKGIVLTVRACETTASDETTPDNVAFLDVQSQPLNSQVQPRQVFRGWMFASSPSLHPFEHPIYDLWLIACKTTAPVPTPPGESPASKPASSAPKSPPAPAKAPANRT